MDGRTLLVRSLLHYWRSNAAVVAGVTAAAAVLGGSLLVGDSVRGSLAATALARLGRASHAVEASGFFGERLATELATDTSFAAGFDAACPLLSVPAVATHATSQRRAGDVQVYGIDERFWAFHGVTAPAFADGREALVSEALAEELAAHDGDSIVLRLHGVSEIPGGSLFGRRDDPARGLRLRVKSILGRDELGEFSLRPRAGRVRAAFVPLATLQQVLNQPGRANVLLAAAWREDASGAELETAFAGMVRLEDLGLRLRALPEAGALQLETTSALVDDDLARVVARVAQDQQLRLSRFLVYLANAIRGGAREIPYSLVAALDREALADVAGREVVAVAGGPVPIVLNDWAASDLGASVGSPVTLEYYLWRDEGRLDTGSSDFEVAAIAPIRGLAADRDVVPEYPGITESLRLSDWDPPFPIELRRVRAKDEAYWNRYRTTPKAFVPLDVGQRLWGQRQGRLTTLRLSPADGVDLQAGRERFARALLEAIHQAPGLPQAGDSRFAIVPVRDAALQAARGSTDFGEYFVYFSFFLVVSGLLLAGLFFRLGLEQRLREVGLLEALGFSAARLRRQFLAEGLVLSGLGGALGAVAAAAYATLVLAALRAFWGEDLGVRELQLHLGWLSPLLGALGAALAAVLAVLWTLRDLRRLSPRSLLAGSLEPWVPRSLRGRGLWPAALIAGALALVLASSARSVSPTAGFFGAGGLLLVAALLLTRRLVAGRPKTAAAANTLAALGLRGVAFRPGRSVLCIALVAAATFVIVAVGAFRREGADVDARDGEAGGYRLMAWSLVPLHHDPGSADGRAALGLAGDDLDGIGVARFRARRGDDASCLNQYQPREPTVLAPSAAFLREGRFAFQSSLAEGPAERANPWLLLERDGDAGGAIPVIADASSLTYILHRKLGDVMPLGDTGVRVRFVATLAPGLLQGELLMGERHFLEAFPEESGYRFFLFDVPESRAAAVSQSLEAALADFGVDVGRTADRLRDFHRVENTYIATFQALGALGLLLGSLGLASVLVRNALEQRGALALLRAVGFRRRHLTRMLLLENAALVGLGFLAGAVPALVAIAPVLLDRRAGLPLALLAVLLLALVLTGALVAWLAVAVIQRLPLVESLRSE